MSKRKLKELDKDENGEYIIPMGITIISKMIFDGEKSSGGLYLWVVHVPWYVRFFRWIGVSNGR